MARITVWRITDPRWQREAFTGEGSAKRGQRFNSKGKKVVYTSGSISLALLEILVRIDDPRLLTRYICIPATFDTTLVKTVDLASLPEGWNKHPPNEVSQEIGDEWLREGKSPVLRVPSVVVPMEHNYLLNPAHRNFGRIDIGEAVQAPFDPRLVG